MVLDQQLTWSKTTPHESASDFDASEDKVPDKLPPITKTIKNVYVVRASAGQGTFSDTEPQWRRQHSSRPAPQGQHATELVSSVFGISATHSKLISIYISIYMYNEEETENMSVLNEPAVRD
jgi:hypothetical protein